MIQFASGILGAAAAALAFGAVHLEVKAGNDLLGPREALSSSQQNLSVASMIDRSSKGDRLNAPTAAAGEATLAFKTPGVENSSIIVRLPVGDVARKSDDPRTDKASAGRRIVACEPSVSVLTPIAKQLAPARCVA